MQNQRALGLVVMSDPSDICPTVIPDLNILYLAVMLDPRALGLVTMSYPSALGMAAMPDPSALVMEPMWDPSALGLAIVPDPSKQQTIDHRWQSNHNISTHTITCEKSSTGHLGIRWIARFGIWKASHVPP